jgi:hypothetical protein
MLIKLSYLYFAIAGQNETFFLLQDSIYRKLRTSSSTTACSIRKFYLLLALFAFYSPSGFAHAPQ